MRLTRREHRVRALRRAAVGLLLGAVILALTAVAHRIIAGRLAGSASAFAARPTVVHVIDGDTIDVRIGRSTTRVRLLGIDTPETKDPRKPVQCFGPEASRRTAELLPVGTIVHLEADRETHDAFGRTLAYVHRDDGLFVNLSLVAEGYADVLIIAPNGSHNSELRAAAAAARAAPIGLWKVCGGPGRPAGGVGTGGGR
ncbi:MAG: thermonuclease family protein [Acidobacteria bacterium]|nr:thermonuclease family protein [Acidobacteriota bacterium]